MRGLFALFMLFSAVLAVTYADFWPHPTPRAGQKVPTFPGGTPPFNPKPSPGTGPLNPETLLRLRRSPEDDKNKITINAQKENGKSSYNVGYERKIFENQYGSIGANIGVNKNPGQKPQSQVGIGGSFHW